MNRATNPHPTYVINLKECWVQQSTTRVHEGGICSIVAAGNGLPDLDDMATYSTELQFIDIQHKEYKTGRMIQVEMTFNKAHMHKFMNT